MPDIIKRYHEIKREILSFQFKDMNDMQRKAIFTANGPLLILAGAGSGKTTVLINRIYNLVKFGDSFLSDFVPPALTDGDIKFMESSLEGATPPDERLLRLISHGSVRPYNILAITFTNKAAGELRERLERKLGPMALDVNAATFHSSCVRILRRNIERLGYASSFTIYDTDDSIRVIKKQMDTLKMSDKSIKPRTILSAISRAKDSMLTPADMLSRSKDYVSTNAAKAYEGYQRELKSSNALDFDDIILLTVRLFESCPDVLEYYQNRFRYIMVDEYQDTNMLQYRLISLLASGHKNLCVVGDDDQSIYKFRGATIENILNFEAQFPGAEVIRLEQNYRSTGNILDAANGVIKNNTERRGKTLWTEGERGSMVSVTRLSDEQEEALFICETIGKAISSGGKFSDNAVLYRMNAQSNSVEREMTRNAIPYKIIGGLRFYERREIKDAISYLSVINNTSDNLRLSRIVNEPKRGIGESTILAALKIAADKGLTLFEVFMRADEFPELSRRQNALIQFIALINQFIRSAKGGVSLDILFDEVMERSGYLPALRLQGEAEATRVENLSELKTNIQHYIAENESPTLAGFLEEIALYTDLDSYNDSDDRVILMTIHSAKGLEFPNVFVTGLEEGIFPGNQSIYNPDEVQEERRLAYVAYTRAKQNLYITCAANRMMFGTTMRNPISRFIKEIPEEFMELHDMTVFANSWQSGGRDQSGMWRQAEREWQSEKQEAAALAYPQSKPLAPASSGSPSGSGAFGKSSAPGKGGVPSVGTVRAPATAKDSTPLSAGMKVTHSVYGEGTILSVKPMGGDRLVEIAFKKAGTKKVMANYARLTVTQ